MRISAHGCRYCEYRCDASDCKRFYCKTHRLIFTSCVTELIHETEGDSDVIGGVHHFTYYAEECPECHREFERRQLKREINFQTQQNKPVGATNG